MGDPQAFVVRTATPDDRPALTKLWAEIMEERAVMDVRVTLTDDAPAQWASMLDIWITSEETVVLVADKQTKIIGYAIGMIRERPLYHYQQRVGIIHDLGVDGHAHQGGVGTALLQAITPWFKDQDIDLVESTIMHLHPMAQAFWRANGAAEVMTTFWHRLK